MKKVMCLLCLFLFGLSLIGCGDTEIPGTSTEGVLVVGMECDYAPFNWTETTKTDTNVAISNVPNAYAEGYDVQMAKKIANGLGLELQIKAYVWDGLIPALKNGEIDMIIAGMSPTEERKMSISFTDGYYRSTHVVLVNKDSKYASAKTMEDFKDAKIAGQINTIYADLVPQLVAKGAVAGQNLKTVPALVTNLKNGIIDGTILEEPVAIGLCSANPELAYVAFENGFDVAEEDVLVSIGVRKECNFIGDINAVLASITTDMRNEMMSTAVNKNSGE